MFLLSKSKSKNESTLTELSQSIQIGYDNTVHSFALDGHWLSFIRSKPWERLYKFQNGYLIGRLNLDEDDGETIQVRPGLLPDEIHPISTGVKFGQTHSHLIVHPFNITNTFYSGDVVSDMQLLIARFKCIGPSAAGVSTLAGAGYLPGNLTLFEEISKIPLLFAYNVTNRSLSSTGSFTTTSPDDEAMIERLVAIIPGHSTQYLGISGGYDSRFVLGILARAGIVPSLCHLEGNETALVSDIAEQCNLSLDIIPSQTAPLPPGVYTLATDAQIYFRGGNYNKARALLAPNSLYHSGLFADSLLKNAFKTAVKLPGSVAGVYPKLITHALLGLLPTTQNGLRLFADAEELKAYLEDELRFGSDYTELKSKKEAANWFYYLHRGIRWTQATTMDLSYFTQPVFLLADLPALSYAISSSMWSNFKKDRVRRLCYTLLPTLKASYDDDKATHPNTFINSLMKVKYEYLERYFARLKGNRKYHQTQFSYEEIDTSSQPAAFDHYFEKPLEHLLTAPGYHRSLRRTAITLHYTLQFLQEGRLFTEEVVS